MGRRNGNGRFMRQSKHDTAHNMIMSWASSVLLSVSSSSGQGFAICVMSDSGKLPPHCLIPRLEYTSKWDLAVSNWVESAPENIQRWTIMKYIFKQPINKNYQTAILKNAADHIRI